MPIFNLQQQIVCIIVRHVHLTTNIDYLSAKSNNYIEYLLPSKMPKYGENMRYAHFAKICENCGKVPNMRQNAYSRFSDMPTG